MIISLILLVLHIALSWWVADYGAAHGIPWVVGFLLSLLFPIVGTIFVLLLPILIKALTR